MPRAGRVLPASVRCRARRVRAPAADTQGLVDSCPGGSAHGHGQFGSAWRPPPGGGRSGGAPSYAGLYNDLARVDLSLAIRADQGRGVGRGARGAGWTYDSSGVLPCPMVPAAVTRWRCCYSEMDVLRYWYGRVADAASGTTGAWQRRIASRENRRALMPRGPHDRHCFVHPRSAWAIRRRPTAGAQSPPIRFHCRWGGSCSVTTLA